MKRRARSGAIAMLLAGAAAMPAQAQTGNTTAPQMIPGLDNFSLPGAQPAPTPTPASTPDAVAAPAVRATPRAVATAVPRERPTPRATPTPSATPTPEAEATPVPVPSAAPSPEPTAAPAPVPTPSPIAVETPTPADDAQGSGNGWIPYVVLLLAAGVAMGWWLRRRRAAPLRIVAPVEPEPPEPTSAVAVAASVAPQRTQSAPAMLDVVPPVVPTGRAQLTLALNPRRAGLNLLTATVESELVVRNDGAVPATAIRIGATLTGAMPGPEGEAAALFTQPLGRPAIPPFALAPGEERRVRLVVALPRADLQPLQAGGRPMFVPVVAVNALYDAGGFEGQAAQAFAVGVERVDSAKLAPLWLDQPPRMFDGLGVRPYAAALVR